MARLSPAHLGHVPARQSHAVALQAAEAPALCVPKAWWHHLHTSRYSSVEAAAALLVGVAAQVSLRQHRQHLNASKYRSAHVGRKLSPSMVVDLVRCPTLGMLFTDEELYRADEVTTCHEAGVEMVGDAVSQLHELSPSKRNKDAAEEMAKSTCKARRDLHFLEQAPTLMELRRALRNYLQLEDPTQNMTVLDLRKNMTVGTALECRLDRIEANLDEDQNRVLTLVSYCTGALPPAVERNANFVDAPPQKQHMALCALALQKEGRVGWDKLRGRVLFLGVDGGRWDFDLHEGDIKTAEQWLQKSEQIRHVSKSGFGVTKVRTEDEAKQVLEVLQGPRCRHRYHAIDTEVRGWRTDKSPYGHGEIVCFSIFCGDDVDFGNGPCLFVDNLDQDGGMVRFFQEYLEDPCVKKVFHNFAFDRAMFFNEGVSVRGFAGDTMHLARLINSDEASFKLKDLCNKHIGPRFAKQDLSSLAQTMGIRPDQPDKLQLCEDQQVQSAWIRYSVFDTLATWKLHKALVGKLKGLPWKPSIGMGGSMMDFYEKIWQPFGEVLAEIEERGVRIDVEYLKEQSKKASSDIQKNEQEFLDWVASEYDRRWPDNQELKKDASKLNPNSPLQIRHLLFGDGPEEVAGVLVGGLGLPLPPDGASTSAVVLEELCGHNPEKGASGCGTALGKIGVEGCRGFYRRCKSLYAAKMRAFMESLLVAADSNDRVHTSLNLHTTTGRLSSTKPNLQNLPSLDKDQFEIRRGIVPSPGNSLLIADYGQLDLRGLAHLSECPALVEALSSGVDIHSKAAYQMYDHIKEAVDCGRVLLEEGTDPTKPLVKDCYPVERRRAKTVNFGIAYGLTSYGLSSQLGISESEAQEIIDKWYAAYPKVHEWHMHVISEVRQLPQEDCGAFALPGSCAVFTARGRPRHIRDIQTEGSNPNLGAERQAINSPVQGTSADIAVEAMIRVHKSEKLAQLGYQMVLQIHDELILEGPEEHAGAALKELQVLMENPFLDGSEMLVPVPVDAKIAKSWFEGKGGAPPPTKPADEDEAEQIS